jgi:hypothetical protein
MNVTRILVCLMAVLAATTSVSAEKFATFPISQELPSPDGKFTVRSVDPLPTPGEFTGVFHSLLLKERATGRSRKLCDYFRTMAVAWSDNGLILATDYLNARTSRALVFGVDGGFAPVVVDKVRLVALLPQNQRVHLTENDHVFVEASTLEGDRLTLRVWGRGARDAKGFSYLCTYSLARGTASCRERTAATAGKTVGESGNRTAR